MAVILLEILMGPSRFQLSDGLFASEFSAPNVASPEGGETDK
jgi:hypothetical protein